MRNHDLQTLNNNKFPYGGKVCADKQEETGRMLGLTQLTLYWASPEYIFSTLELLENIKKLAINKSCIWVIKTKK